MVRTSPGSNFVLTWLVYPSRNTTGWCLVAFILHVSATSTGLSASHLNAAISLVVSILRFWTHFPHLLGTVISSVPRTHNYMSGRLNYVKPNRTSFPFHPRLFSISPPSTVAEFWPHVSRPFCFDNHRHSLYRTLEYVLIAYELQKWRLLHTHTHTRTPPLKKIK